MRTALANTLVLGLLASIFAIGLGVLIGIISAVKRSSIWDNLGTGLAFFGLSMPTFWFGLVLIVLTGIVLRVALPHDDPALPVRRDLLTGPPGFRPLRSPATSRDSPAIVLSVQEIAIYSRYMRTAHARDAELRLPAHRAREGHPETARDLPARVPQRADPAHDVHRIDIGAIAGGLIITESIFDYPGMGSYFLDESQRRLSRDAAVDDDRDHLRDHLQPARRPVVRVARPEDSP